MATTVGELIIALAKCRKDAVVLVSSDAEGNDFHTLHEVSDSTGDVFKGFHPKAPEVKDPVVLWPMHDSLEPQYDGE